jgi:F-box protein 11
MPAIIAEEENNVSRTALAFMSYVNVDDQNESGRLTQLRERLSGEVRMQTGAPFEIFQDKKDIKLGQQWQERINDALDATLFLIPIITPAFFRSDACRDELERFLNREEALGRGDLILPVYYVSCPALQDKAKREHDKLAQCIAARQYADWRELRFEELTSPPVRKALAKMAEQIVEALERSNAEAVRRADMAKVVLRSNPPEKDKIKTNQEVLEALRELKQLVDKLPKRSRG